MNKIKINISKMSVETVGAYEALGYEFKATVSDPSLLQGCKEFINYCVDSVFKRNKIIKADTPFKYGYWATRGEVSDDGFMRFFEPLSTNIRGDFGDDEVFGINSCVKYWIEQHRICNKVNSSFFPPDPRQLIVISDGVYEGESVQGVRYPSPEHMSGWWFTTDRYNGDIKTLKTVHAYHVTSTRPDLAKYISLPFGWRFDTARKDIYFDIKAANIQ